jgi:hypothetical protein
MGTPSPELQRLFARTKLSVLPEDYYMVHLPGDAKPIPGEWYRPATTRFGAFIREPREITLIVSRRKWLRMQRIFDKYEVSEALKVIIFDVVLPMTLSGFVAAITERLAEARISVLPISSYHRDHILVHKKDLPRAVRILRTFLVSFRKRKKAAVRTPA